MTIDKLKAALKARDLAIIFETYHKEMMVLAGIDGKNGVIIGFVGAKVKHDILRAKPRAALEMPLRIAARDGGCQSIAWKAEQVSVILYRWFLAE